MFWVAPILERPFYVVNFYLLNSKDLRNFVCFKAVLYSRC